MLAMSQTLPPSVGQVGRTFNLDVETCHLCGGKIGKNCTTCVCVTVTLSAVMLAVTVDKPEVFDVMLNVATPEAFDLAETAVTASVAPRLEDTLTTLLAMELLEESLIVTVIAAEAEPFARIGRVPTARVESDGLTTLTNAEASLVAFTDPLEFTAAIIT